MSTACSGWPRLELIQSLYDFDTVGMQCCVYQACFRGRSVGGTNPSLAGILPYGCQILVFDCVFNRYTLRESGGYLTSEESLASLQARSMRTVRSSGAR